MSRVTHRHDNGEHPTAAMAKHDRHRYKHTLRKSPYFVSLILLLLATALTLLNIYVSKFRRM